VRSLKALVIFALGLVGASEVLAADLSVATTNPPATTGPTWSVVGSLAPTYTDNALFTPDNRRGDLYVEPDFSLRLDGRLAPDLSYRLYARTLLDAFATVTDANEASVRLGGRLTKSISDWRVTVGLENRNEFEGIYHNRLFVAEDPSASVGRDVVVGNVTFTPTVLLTYRFADVAEVRRWRLDLLVPFEVGLTPAWSIVSTPMIELFWFTDGLNSGRQDQIYSASLGLRYRISKNVSLTTSALYEQRTSNRPLRHYTDFEIGPKLDFAL
jgi:hypothetical protein